MGAQPARRQDNAARKPRYLELADDLRTQILRGDFPEADQFPTENVLCARYGVSRFTVREALRTLQGEGLIQRRRGSGTVIRPAAARGGALHQPLSNVEEILQYARDTSVVFERRGRVALPRKVAEQIGLARTGKWFGFHGVRCRIGDERPIALTEAFIHPDLADAAAGIDLAEPTLFRQLEQITRVKVAQVTQDIQAVAASADTAALLRIARRSPCLRILRCYFDEGGRVIELSVSHHPGDRFAYNMHIEVDG